MGRATFLRVFPLIAMATIAGISARAQSITGLITDADRGNALASMVAAAYAPDPTCSTARVVCWKNVANATTSSTGRYTLNVPSGSLRVLAYDPTGLYATQFSGDAESFDVTPVTAVSGAQPVPVNFALRAAGSIIGTAVTGGGARPGIVVAAYNISGTRRGFTTTAKNGTFSFVLPPGSYKLVAYDETGTFATAFFRDRPDFATADPVPVTAGGTFTGAEFSLPIGARFSGIVTDTSGTPLSGATISAYNAAGSQVATAFTSTDGRFQLTLPGGTYRFTASDESRVFASAFPGEALSFDSSPAITISGGQARTNLQFKMQIGGRVAGKVTDALSGTALAGISVAAYNAGGSLRTSTTTDQAGAYELLVPAGAYSIAAWDTNLVFAPQYYPLRTVYFFASPVTASASGTIQLQPFALQHAGRFSGVVSSQNGAPVAGAVVAAYDSDGYAAATSTTSASGQYRLAVNPGSYRVIAYDPQLRYAVSFAGAASFDATPLRSIAANANQVLAFTVVTGTCMSGVVVNALSEPVAEVEVTAYDVQGSRMGSVFTSDDGSFQLVLVAGSYKFGARDPRGRYPSAFLGGTSLAAAPTITVAASGAPQLVIRLAAVARRRSVRR